MRRTNTALTLTAAWALTILFASVALGQTRAATGAPTRCNDTPASPVSYVPLPGHPFSTVASPDGCWLFVSLTSASPKSFDGVALLRRSRGSIELVKVFPVAGSPTGMTLTHDGKLLVVADGEYVVFMDTARMTAGREDSVLGYMRDSDDYAGSVYVNTSADDRLLFVSDESVEAISVIDLPKARAEGFKESAIVGKIPVGNAPIALTFSRDGRWLYTTSQIAPEAYKWPIECKPEGAPDPSKVVARYPQGAIIVVDVERARRDPANSVTAKVPAGCSPVRLAMTPGGERVFVTARNSNALLGFDTSKFAYDPAHALVGTVPVGTSPVGVAVVLEGKLVLVTNSNRFSKDTAARQTLTVIDASKVGAGASAIVGSIPAGAFPREFGASPDGRTLFVSNYNSNEPEVIDLARMPLEKK